MTETELHEQLDTNPFVPFRIHLVSGKTLDVLASNAAWTLNNSLLVIRNPSQETRHAEGYDVITHANIERLQQLPIGKRTPGKRKSA
jgi:hypothetical protein